MKKLGKNGLSKKEDILCSSEEVEIILQKNENCIPFFNHMKFNNLGIDMLDKVISSYKAHLEKGIEDVSRYVNDNISGGFKTKLYNFKIKLLKKCKNKTDKSLNKINKLYHILENMDPSEENLTGANEEMKKSRLDAIRFYKEIDEELNNLWSEMKKKEKKKC